MHCPVFDRRDAVVDGEAIGAVATKIIDEDADTSIAGLQDMVKLLHKLLGGFWIDLSEEVDPIVKFNNTRSHETSMSRGILIVYSVIVS